MKRWRRWLLSASAVAALVALAAIDRVLLPALRRGPDMADARWIWAAGDWRHPRTLGFFAAADVWLDKGPAEARLNIAADEEFVVWVNGARAASGRYDGGRPLAGFGIGRLLVPGGNRIVAELRSSRGAGGFLAWLEVDGEILAATGPDWRVFRDSRPGLIRGWLPLSGGEAPQVWGAAPMARWAALRAGGAAAATFAERLESDSPWAAVLGQQLVVDGPARGAAAEPASRWERAWPASAPLPQLRSAVALDWGQEFTGYVELDFLGPGDALLFAGREAVPDAARLRADAVIVRADGQSVWRDAVPRRFRYLLVAGEPRLVGARAYPTADPPWAPTPPTVLLGVVRAPLRPAVEDKLRREFQGFAGLVVGQGS